MLTWREIYFMAFAIVVGMVVLFLVACWATDVLAAECPNVGEPCKVITITPQEEQLLIRQGGILDSAAAARYLDLGNVAAYFRMKLANAPAGEVKAPPADKPTEPVVKPANP